MTRKDVTPAFVKVQAALRPERPAPTIATSYGDVFTVSTLLSLERHEHFADEADVLPNALESHGNEKRVTGNEMPGGAFFIGQADLAVQKAHIFAFGRVDFPSPWRTFP